MGAPMWADDLGRFGVVLTFHDDCARIALSGPVDVACGAALIDAATSAVARYKFVELDLSAVAAIDDVGVRALVKVKRFADAYDALVAVIGVPPVVDAALDADTKGFLGLVTAG